MAESRSTTSGVGEGSTRRFDYMRVDGVADALLEVSAPGSLVVNATGLGKDLPGSPLRSVRVRPRDGRRTR